MALTRWRWLWIHDRETSLVDLIRLLNLRLRDLADFLANGGGGGAGDGLYAAEGFFFNAGNVLVAAESDWLDIPSDFTITNAELVGDPAGDLSVDVYVSSYGAWDVWTLISAADPLVLSGTDKSTSFMTGWTKTFTGGHYLKFVITGTPSAVTKATATLTLTAPISSGTVTASPSGPAGGVLSGTYPNPTFAEDMATQAEVDLKADITYVDAGLAASPWKKAVRAATTVAGTLASSFENGDTIDGVTLATGDRILIKNQAAGAENGIYVVNASGAPTRATDADSSAELVNATCYVSEGTANADTQWSCSTNAPITVGATSLTFVQLTSGGGAVVQYPVWSPFKPPTSANALDVEFAASSSIAAWPAGWAASAGGDFPNALYPATEPGRFSTYDNAGAWKGRVAACPGAGTDFSLAAHLAVTGDQGNFTLLGIGLHTSTTITSVAANNVLAYLGYHASIGGYGIGVENNGAYIANWGSNHLIMSGAVVYVRRVGAQYWWGFTQDGLRGPEAGPFAMGVAPSFMSVAMYSSHGAVAMQVIRFVRHLSGAGTGARQLWGGLL